MEITRRTVLRTGLAAGAVSALGLPPLTAPAIAAPPLSPAGTTLERTLVIADRAGRPGGYAPILIGPGEPHLVRSDFAGGLPGREGRRKPVLAVAQLSDVHIVDAQSPARVEWSDRFDDQDQPGDPISDLTSSAHRPQEMMSAHVADAMVRQINTI